jgi:hypothetical protein
MYAQHGELLHRPYEASALAHTTVKRRQRWNELVLRGKMLVEVVKVFEEVPLLSPDILSDVESLHYVYSVAEWEMGLAEALLHRGDDEKQAAGDNNSQHGFVSFDMYWRTLIGNMTEEEDGPVTADTYAEFRQAENASQSSQLDC